MPPPPPPDPSARPWPLHTPGALRAPPRRAPGALRALLVAAWVLVPAVWGLGFWHALAVAARAEDRAPDDARRPPVEARVGPLRFLVPLTYRPIVFQGEGLWLYVFADGLAPHGADTNPRTPREMARSELEDGARVRVAFDPRVHSQQDRLGIFLSILDERVEPSALGVVLSGTETPVPPGLRMRRAEEDGRTGRSRSDRFDLEAAHGGPPEAIYCTSPLTHTVRSGLQPLSNLRCTHHLIYHNLETTIDHERRHLARWRDIRDGAVALLDRLSADAAAAAAGVDAAPGRPS